MKTICSILNTVGDHGGIINYTVIVFLRVLSGLRSNTEQIKIGCTAIVAHFLLFNLYKVSKILRNNKEKHFRLS